MYIDSFNYDTM